MEAVLESVPGHSSTEPIKLNEVSEEITPKEESVCHKSNGVGEAVNVAESNPSGNTDTLIEKPCPFNDTTALETTTADTSNTPCPVDTVDVQAEVSVELMPTEARNTASEADSFSLNQIEESINVHDNIEDPNKQCQPDIIQTEEVPAETENVESFTSDNVRFQTEVLVETNDNDINEIEINDHKADDDSANNILSELGQSLELSEALRSSDVNENVENNNGTIRQEMFNKEELLDILEGKDVQSEAVLQSKSKMMETQLALEQLSRLKKTSRKSKTNDIHKKKISSKKIDNVSKEEVQQTGKGEVKEESKTNETTQKKKISSKKIDIVGKEEVQQTAKGEVKEESIVNALVKDWEDEDAQEENEVNEKDMSLKSTEEVVDKNEINTKEEKRTSVDSSTSDGQTLTVNKSGDESQPQRRLGRVIKKKVIFDPDNPDTFTKGKTPHKNKEAQNDKEQPPSKKIKVEQGILRAKSKSPVSKMQWKKPSPKNSKQNRRLTEIDKLLMDEGAVNMIYQLTPEAPKGKKNMKTKAEFIKKLQSSTPEGKEMKFRERKKECGKEEGEAKRILGGKQRSSLSSSVKSPSVCEDFENHSADDSIIYRRHSSSSYSSSCMSPRRLSDVEATVNQSVANTSQQMLEVKPNVEMEGSNHFKSDNMSKNEIINKDDCLTIKKKLNSKLSMALNKRKRDSIKSEKSSKKYIKRNDGQGKEGTSNYKYLSLTFDHRVAEICIRKSGSKYNVELLKEMADALAYVDTRMDISVTLLTSNCGALCSNLDLGPLVENDAQKRIKVANEIANSVRSLLWSLEQHSKLVCSSVWGACSGIALALVALSHMTLAAENATFAMTSPATTTALLASGVSAVIASCRPLPQSLVNDLLIFGRCLSASEALQSGLVSRVLWSGGFSGQVQTVVQEIAAQPMHILSLKKKLLNLRKSSEDTFLSQIEAERELMVEYWTSEEGQQALRAYVEHS